MNNSTYTVKVPGKLLIAGEYAVLESRQKAVVASVNRYVTAYIEPSAQNELSLPQLGLEDIRWNVNDGRIEFSEWDSRLSFIQNSISTVSQFLNEKSVEALPFRLQVESELDDSISGKKYGLGSSAAITTAVVSAILSLHNSLLSTTTNDDIFKLSAIAHVKTQGNGSGADIAAAVYGGWLEYSAFSAKWLLSQLKHKVRITDMIEKPWPNLFIRHLIPPSSLYLLVGWTKESAATSTMIKMVENFRDSNFELYSRFLKESSIATLKLIDSFKANDTTGAINALMKNRKALKNLSENAHVNIETEKLKSLCDIAEAFGSGKSSGAGGGDCGIAFLEDDSQKYRLYEAWKSADIDPLDLSISETGVLIQQK